MKKKKQLNLTLIMDGVMQEIVHEKQLKQIMYQEMMKQFLELEVI